MTTDSKREAIIEAAFRRFAHFGVPKTTMNEISDDLGISKASLYYYFPDKLNLFAAVLQKILESATAHEPISAEDPLEAMEKYLERRTEFILKNQNILEYLKTTLHNIPEELKQLFKEARQIEFDSLINIFTQGFEKGVFKTPAAEEAATLFFEALSGMRYIIQLEYTNFLPDKDMLHTILAREKAFAQIFLKGLTV